MSGTSIVGNVKQPEVKKPEAKAEPEAKKDDKKAVEPPKNPCDLSKIKTGSVFTRHSSGRVTGTQKDENGDPVYLVENSDGVTWGISPNIVEKEFRFADQFDEEEKVNRTSIIETLVANPRTAMTVNFHKKPDHKDAAKALEEGKGKLSTRAWNKKVQEAYTGKESTLVGYHTGSFDGHSRLQFIKLDGKNATKGGDFRLVDTRTVNWVIVNRTKYVVK